MVAGATAWPIHGHQAAIELLSRALASDQVGHAYLFTGPEGIGRRTLAETFAQALVCTAAVQSRPCGQCSACRRVTRGIHPDVLRLSLETQAAESGKDSKNTRVSIDAVRELRASVALRPLEASWRVAILDDVDRFSRDAYDALLKTLEEPPPFVVLLLIATEVEAVPETIRSRCRPVVLEPLSRQEVAAVLSEQGIEPDQAARLAALTRGRVGQALSLAADPKALDERARSIDEALEMIADPLAAIGGARRLAELYRRGQRQRVEAQLDVLLGLWRDLLLAESGCSDQLVNGDVAARIEALARQWSLSEIQHALRATYEALADLSINVQPRLALDRMATQWPRPSRR